MLRVPSVPVWLSSVRIQMLMLGFSPHKHYNLVIKSRFLARSVCMWSLVFFFSYKIYIFFCNWHDANLPNPLYHIIVVILLCFHFIRIYATRFFVVMKHCSELRWVLTTTNYMVYQCEDFVWNFDLPIQWIYFVLFKRCTFILVLVCVIKCSC